MKVLLLNKFFHKKNLHAFVNYKSIDCDIINTENEFYNTDLTPYDIIYSPSTPLPVKKYPYKKFIFGPHFDVFPDEFKMQMIEGKNSVYIQPSQWAVDTWKKNFIFTHNITILPMPFGVDTEEFSPTLSNKERTEVFIYFKRRNPDELYFLADKLNEKKIRFHFFEYGNYNEDDYKMILNNSKYGIWLGTHESQGFALEEALSCDVPLFVWEAVSMNQEYGKEYDNNYNYPATTTPYWDSRCGNLFFSTNEFDKKFSDFLKKVENNEYSPRSYMVENLSIVECEKKFLQICDSIDNSHTTNNYKITQSYRKYQLFTHI